MFRITIILISFLVLALFLSSCTKLKSEFYVGEKEKIPSKEVKTESIWQYEDEVFYVRILDSLRVIASSLEWEDSTNEYKVVTYDVVFTKLGDDSFLNIKEKDGLYNILRFVSSADGTIAFFGLDKKQLEGDMKQGIVEATEKDSDYILDLNKKELDTYVSENINNLFKVKTPGIIKPLAGIFKDNVSKK
jgi:hypothetical protein